MNQRPVLTESGSDKDEDEADWGTGQYQLVRTCS